MIKQITLLTSVLFFAVQLFSQSNQDFNPETITNVLQQYVGDDTPGMAVGIVKDGQIIYENYFGYANLEHKIKFNESTRSNIASTAKQFTALMILQLSKEGKLNLEDDIRKYLPSLYPKVKEEIKIRHLINHTSGIRDYLFIMEIMNKATWRQVGIGNNDVIELLEKQEELTNTPGSEYLYSNSGYIILAKIIEEIAGTRFNDYSEQFFQELGMKETSFVIPNRADSYSDWGGGLWLSTPAVTKVNGDGFLFTTLKDQLIYEQAIQNAKQNNNVLLMESQQPIPNSEYKDYGFGVELDGRLGRVAQYHSGSTFGYNSHTTRFPEENLSVFVMSNNGSIWSGNVADKISSLLLPKLEKQTTYNSLLDKSTTEGEQVQKIGQYLSPEGFLIRVEEEGGKLIWREANNSPYQIIQENDNRFYADFNRRIKIRFFEDKVVEFYPLEKTITYKRHEFVPATLADIEGFVGKYHSLELDMSFEITMTAENQLKALFSNRDRELDVEVLNRNELLADNFIMKVERDQFDRATDILVTLTFRAKNNRFKKETHLHFQPKIETENGSIQVTTIGSRSGDNSDILLTKNYPNGNEIWSKQFGGGSYDKASSILATNDGYLIIGSTSSYGNGNYDMFVIKTDKAGKKQWQNTYGDFYNEYGYTAEETEGGFLIKGTKQYCTSNTDVFNRECTTNVWIVSIDKDGKEIGNKLLEKI